MSPCASCIRPAVQAEFDASAAAEARGQFSTAFSHLERARELAKAAAAHRLRVHWQMFRFALRQQVAAQIVLQLWRIAAAALLPVIGLVSQDNTSAVHVASLRPVPVTYALSSRIFHPGVIDG